MLENHIPTIPSSIGNELTKLQHKQWQVQYAISDKVRRARHDPSFGFHKNSRLHDSAGYSYIPLPPDLLPALNKDKTIKGIVEARQAELAEERKQQTPASNAGLTCTQKNNARMKNKKAERKEKRRALKAEKNMAQEAVDKKDQTDRSGGVRRNDGNNGDEDDVVDPLCRQSRLPSFSNPALLN